MQTARCSTPTGNRPPVLRKRDASTAVTTSCARLYANRTASFSPNSGTSSDQDTSYTAHIAHLFRAVLGNSVDQEVVAGGVMITLGIGGITRIGVDVSTGRPNPLHLRGQHRFASGKDQ